jgi:methanogenic corrinoid protein MtbC1
MAKAIEQLVSETIRTKRDVLAEKAVARQYALKPERWKPYGSVGREKSVRDVGYHLSYLSESIAASDPGLFVEYIKWARVLFAELCFSEDVLPTTLACIGDVLEEALSAEMMDVARPSIQAGLQQARSAHRPVPSFLTADQALSTLAQRYLDDLLHGKRHVASQRIVDAVDQGTPVRDIYLQVFQPAQREVGRLWQTNQISVALEHYVTAATQLIMSQLYPRIFSTEKSGRRLVATCVGGELHEIGVRMVADFFEMEGWDTTYLGANTPAAGVLQMLADRKADVLAISATMTPHISAVAEMISRVRASDVGQVRILVGGYPFNLSPDLWRRVGADAYAQDAQQAVLVANQLADSEGAQ